MFLQKLSGNKNSKNMFMYSIKDSLTVNTLI